MIKCSYCNCYFNNNWTNNSLIPYINKYNRICNGCDMIIRERTKFNNYLRFNILRKFVKLRSICIFWLKISCENIYKPGNKGFIAEINDFNKFKNSLCKS